MKKIIVFVLIFSSFCSFLKVGALSAKSAVVINGDTLDVLYSVNKDMKMPMASTTKIMTALILCEHGKLSEEITVTKEMIMVEGTSMGLSAGDKITLKDLLYGLMLCSGNDAANAIAITLGGSLRGFAEMMNEKANKLKLKNTHFVTPSGLDADGHYTSAYDLAVITKEAFKYSEFCKAVSSKTATVLFGNPQRKIILSNHNKLLKMYDDIVGVKTGFTKKSGRCLVSASKKDDKFVIAVTLNDKDDWADHRTLLDIGLSSVNSIAIESVEKTIDVVNGKSKTTVVGSAKQAICISNSKTIKYETYLPAFLYAPIITSQTIGYQIILSDNKEIGKIEIKSSKTIKQEKPTNSQILFENLFCIIRSINER